MRRFLKKIKRKNLLIILLLAIISIISIFLSILFDDIYKSPHQVLKAILNFDENNVYHLEIRKRILKMIAMVLCIVGLSVSGLIMQSLSRNALASPGVLGMMGSIKLGATILSFVGVAVPLLGKQAILMVFGGLPILILFLVLKFSKIKISGLSIVFIGIALGVVFSSIDWLIMYNNEEGTLFVQTFIQSNFTLVSKENLIILTWFVIIPTFLALLFSRYFTILSVGDSLSNATGNNASKLRVFGFALVVIMVPVTVILGGNLLFAGIIAPNIAKLVIKNKKFSLLLLSTIFISITIISITAIISSYIPIHINSLLNVVAAPVFILLARRSYDKK